MYLQILFRTDIVTDKDTCHGHHVMKR